MLEIDARARLGPDRGRDIVRGADERRDPGVDVTELRGVQVRGAAGDEHLVRAPQ